MDRVNVKREVHSVNDLIPQFAGDGTVYQKEGVSFVDSRRVAEVFGKEHHNVLKAIDTMLGQGAPAVSFNFSLYNSELSSNKGKQYRFCEMDRKGFMLLAMGFTGAEAMQWKLKLIDAFDYLERRARDAAARPPVKGDALVSMAIAIRDHELEAIRLNEEQERLKVKCAILESEQARQADEQRAITARQTALELSCHEFTVMGYSNYRDIRLDTGTAKKLGKRATTLANQLGLSIGKVRDPRYGIVNSYPEEVLEQAFAEMIKELSL